jgi:hypothetical protein
VLSKLLWSSYVRSYAIDCTFGSEQSENSPKLTNVEYLVESGKVGKIDMNLFNGVNLF